MNPLEVLESILVRMETVLSKARDDDFMDDYTKQAKKWSKEGKGSSIEDDMSEFDPEDEDDAAAQWLKENEGKADEKSSDKPAVAVSDPSKEGIGDVTAPRQRKKAVRWAPKPTDKYSDQQLRDIHAAMAKGFSPREAEHIANAHDHPKDIYSAMESYTIPNPPSEQMLSILKPIASKHVEAETRFREKNADPTRNPLLHRRGQIHSAKEKAYASFDEARSALESSDDFKKMNVLDRSRALRNLRKEHDGKIDSGAVIASHTDVDSHGEHRRAQDERIMHMLFGHQSSGAADAPGSSVGVSSAMKAGMSSSVPQGTSMAAAAQHAGSSAHGEDEKPDVSTIKDPALAWYHKASGDVGEPELRNILISKLSPEMQARYHSIQTAKAKPAADAPKKMVIRRKQSE